MTDKNQVNQNDPGIKATARFVYEIIVAIVVSVITAYLTTVLILILARGD